MKQIRIADERADTAREKLKAQLLKKYPTLTDVRIYNHRNIFIESDNFSLDMYASRTYNDQSPKLNCKMDMNEIPSEEEAIQHIRQMKREKKAFIRAMTLIYKNILCDEVKEDA